MKNNYSIEFPETLNLLLKNFVLNYQKMYVKAELIDKRGTKKVRVTFEGTREMRDEFINELNKEIKNNKV